MLIPILTRHGRRHKLLPPSLVHTSIDHDNVQLAMILQYGNVVDRVAVHKDQVRVVACLDLTHLIGAEHQFRDPVGCRDDGLVRGEAHQVLEVGEIAGRRCRVGSMRSRSHCS